MVEVEQLNKMPVKYLGGECIVPEAETVFIDEHNVENIRFPFDSCGVMQLGLGRSGHFAAACVDTSSQSSVVLDEKALGDILRSGDWTCNYGPRGSMMLTRQAPPSGNTLASVKSFWGSLLESCHMNGGRSQQKTSWADVSKNINPRLTSVNNVFRFLNRRHGL